MLNYFRNNAEKFKEDEPGEPALEWKFDFALPCLSLVWLIERDA